MKISYFYSVKSILFNDMAVRILAQINEKRFDNSDALLRLMRYWDKEIRAHLEEYSQPVDSEGAKILDELRQIDVLFQGAFDHRQNILRRIILKCLLYEWEKTFMEIYGLSEFIRLNCEKPDLVNIEKILKNDIWEGARKSHAEKAFEFHNTSSR